MRGKIVFIAVSLLLLCPIGTLFAADVGGQDAEKELKKLQGTWVMVSGEMGGKKAADEHVKQSKIIYEGNKIQIVVPNQTGETIVADIVKIDPVKNPKEMHFIRKTGPNAGKTLIGIFEFEGDDQYKFAFDPTGSMTLKEFVTKDGTGHIRNTWKRVKP
ncbi:MAG: TIGR03067 domain-containing protein [Desulfomonile tiedjei]|nr:TIGR03067 domain-containing protein [Desulfomonile tiedjei]